MFRHTDYLPFTDVATEQIGHVEMIATMVARLLEGAERPWRGRPAPVAAQPLSPAHHLKRTISARGRRLAQDWASDAILRLVYGAVTCSVLRT